MSGQDWAAIATAAAAILGVVATYLKQRAHSNDPNAHTQALK